MVFLFTRKKIQLCLTKLDRGGFINYNANPVLCDAGYDTLSLADGDETFYVDLSPAFILSNNNGDPGFVLTIKPIEGGGSNTADRRRRR